MLLIPQVYADTSLINRQAMAQAQAILRAQFPALTEADIVKLPEQLRNPLKQKFKAILLVAEDGNKIVRGFALLLHAPDIQFAYLEYIAGAMGKTGRGISRSLGGSDLGFFTGLGYGRQGMPLKRKSARR